MSKILTEKGRMVQVEAVTTSGNYEYAASYSYNDEKTLLRLQVNINKKMEDEGGAVYCGYMSIDGGTRNMNFPETRDNDIVSHVTMFENIMKEVNETLAGM